MDGILTGIITLRQNGPENNGNEGVHDIPQSSRTKALRSHGLVSYPGHLLVLLLCRSAVSIFYNPSR